MPNEDESHLSVNALEVEPLDAIANYFRDHFQSGRGKVAISCLKGLYLYPSMCCGRSTRNV